MSRPHHMEQSGVAPVRIKVDFRPENFNRRTQGNPAGLEKYRHGAGQDKKLISGWKTSTAGRREIQSG